MLGKRISQILFTPLSGAYGHLSTPNHDGYRAWRSILVPPPPRKASADKSPGRLKRYFVDCCGWDCPRRVLYGTRTVSLFHHIQNVEKASFMDLGRSSSLRLSSPVISGPVLQLFRIGDTSCRQSELTLRPLALCSLDFPQGAPLARPATALLPKRPYFTTFSPIFQPDTGKG